MTVDELSPSTSLIIYLNLVVNSGEMPVPVFLEAFKSTPISLSSLPVSKLNLIFFFDH